MEEMASCRCKEIAQLRGEVTELFVLLPADQAVTRANETLSVGLKNLVDTLPASIPERARTIITNAADLHHTSVMTHSAVDVQIINAIGNLNQTIASLEAEDKKFHTPWAQMVTRGD
ncbi:MAG: hypothetical protein FWF45_02055 [Coriobacteriia bacterium]|nr:hypothetical protein [Coriobacteriia bacterium]